jgi:Mrp family chromosome partitioning ATPase
MTSVEWNPHINRTVAVMSGKGGVGKSSVSALLAVELARRGLRMGIMDADITGPSIPTMLGIVDIRPEVTDRGIHPVSSRKYGIQVISINLLLDKPEQPVIWRGPLLSKAILEFWNEVLWSGLDILIVDMPPGTGDVPLTVLQSIPLEGVVMVSSPQDLAFLIVKKAVHMVQQLQRPILGLVENLSTVFCPKCGEVIHPFGQPRGQKISTQLQIPFLGEIPIDPILSEYCDSGRIEDYESVAVKNIVDKLITAL